MNEHTPEPSAPQPKTVARRMLNAAPAILIALCFLIPSIAPCGERDRGEVRAASLTDRVSLELVWVPPGEFTMGSPPDEPGRSGPFLTEAVRKDSDRPGYDTEASHRVAIEKGFWIGATEVTQAQWNAIMGTSPSRFQGDDLPVESVTWLEAQLFLKRANENQSLGAFRLPREAEWEYACRAGTSAAFAGERDELAWSRANSGGETHAVATRAPNDLGLFDMHGNVNEWCQDWFGSYDEGLEGPLVDPRGATEEENRRPENARAIGRRVTRGGSFTGRTLHCRSADRGAMLPDDRQFYVGLRVVWTAFAADKAPR